MPEDLTGQRFGRLTVLCRADDHVTTKGYRNHMWTCRCDCGTIKDIRSKSLKSGISQSCGCLQKEQLSSRASKHHGFGTRLYHVWNSMRQRCNNPNHYAYVNYGGRGIKICSDWDNYESFRDWAMASGYDELAPRGQMTLDRIDVNGNYEPSNCRWADMKAQTRNRRNTVYLEHDGEVKPIAVWMEETGLTREQLIRLYARATAPVAG